MRAVRISRHWRPSVPGVWTHPRLWRCEHPGCNLKVEPADKQIIVVLWSDVFDPDLHQPAKGAATWVLKTTGLTPNGGDDPVLIPNTTPVIGACILVPDLLVGIPTDPQAPTLGTRVRLLVLDALILGRQFPFQDIAMKDDSTGLGLSSRRTHQHCCCQQYYNKH